MNCKIESQKTPMPEASTNTTTAPAPAAVADGVAVAPPVGFADDGQEGVLDRLRDGRGAPLTPRARRAKAVPVLRSLRCATPRPQPRSSGPSVTRAIVDLKADSHAAAARYVGRTYLDRRFLFSLDFGPTGAARTEQHQADYPPAFEELAADAQALLDAAVETADAAAPPPLPQENDAALWATVDAIESSEAGAAPAPHYLPARVRLRRRRQPAMARPGAPLR